MWKQSMILHFSLQFFHFKTFCYRSRCWSWWGNLDRGQYPFQQITFVNLVVPSPRQTEPYNKWTISLDSLCLIFFIPLLRFLFRFPFYMFLIVRQPFDVNSDRYLFFYLWLSMVVSCWNDKNMAAWNNSNNRARFTIF